MRTAPGICRLAGTFLVMLLAATAAMAADTPLEYELRFDKPNTHLLDITIRAAGLTGPAVEFAMPAWAPGAYRINDYAEMVQNFRAESAEGRALAWRKTDKQTWRIEAGSAKSVSVRYKLFGNTMANDWVQYNGEHAFIGGPAAWMYLVGGKERQVRLKIETPQGWRVATGMARTGDATYTAPDYDTFADCPIEISDFAEETFQQAGTTYHVAVHDGMGRKSFSRFTRDVKRLTEVIPAMYPTQGGRAALFTDYWFLIHVWPANAAGLEHSNSTSILLSNDWDSTRPAARYGTEYDLKLFVTAHEFYHAWNVKRLRPKPLGPFDYSREAYTTSLWHAEGVTSYYGQLLLVRAGLLKPEQYLDSIGELMTAYEQQPGRGERSLAQTSWDTWFERRATVETNLSNTTYSYYDGGQVVAHLLDFAIRQATGNRKSLDDWMRLLYEHHALPKPGFEPEDLVRAASEVAGKDLSDFFRRYVDGKEPLPYEEYFGYAGIRVEKATPRAGWLGLALRLGVSGHGEIASITPGSPAELIGLSQGDLITALDGREMAALPLYEALEGKKPGETVRLMVNRRGRELEFNVQLGTSPYFQYRLTPMERMSDLQQVMHRSWLGKQ